MWPPAKFEINGKIRIDLSLKFACDKSMTKPWHEDADDMEAKSNSHSDSELGAQSKKGNAEDGSGLHNALDSAIAAIQTINRKRKQSPTLGDTLSSLYRFLHEELLHCAALTFS